MRPPTPLSRRGAACPPSTSGRRERRICAAPRASSSSSSSSSPNLAPPNAAGVDGTALPPTVTVTTVESIADVPASAWDAVVRGQAEYNPFVSHTFLRLLEESGSVEPSTGWLPRHYVATLDGGGGEVVGVCPAYLCGHGAAQYVFDANWAEFAERALGVPYFPKLISCVPAAPVTGPRLLAAPGPTAPAVRAALAAALAADARDGGLSGAHVNFCDGAGDAVALAGAGFDERHGVQYWWHNGGRGGVAAPGDTPYASFADFEVALRQSKRKLVRQERKKVRGYGLKIERLTGAAALTPDVADAMYEFYKDTTYRRWGRTYLTRSFFKMLFAEMADDLLLVHACDDAGRPVAGALNLIGSHALFGRHWGAARGVDLPGLHFELSYYQAIEHAIETGLARVEAGAQGEHKLARGYVPVKQTSFHALVDGRLDAAVRDFLRRERAQMAGVLAMLGEEASPYKKADVK